MAENYKAPDLVLVGESHIKAYRETDGEVGYEWNGVNDAAAHHHRRQVRGAEDLGADLRS